MFIFTYENLSQFLSLDEAAYLQNVARMNYWQGKRILVTGGAVRIGRGFVEALQQRGAEVVVHYNQSKEAAEALSAFTVQADLSDPASYAHLLKEAGSIDVLINNASAFTKDRLSQSTPERVEKEFRINVMAPLELMRQFAQQTEEGAVLNLLDRRIRAHDPSCVAYGISKKALFELTKISALELAPHIRVNGVAPGPILPPPGCTRDSLKERAGLIPLDRIPAVEEVVAAGCYLLESPSITGQVIFVDGGQHLLGNGV